MISELHQRLAELNRGWREPVPGRLPTSFGSGRTLAEVLEGYELTNHHGAFFGREDRLGELYSDGEVLVASLLEGMGSLPQNEVDRELVPLGTVEPQRVALVDLETTGLHGRPLFLVGTMCLEEGELVVRQYFARDYSEERPLLCHVAESLAQAQVLVTFNGRSFDVPYLQDRMTYHRLACPRDFAQVDLLHPCRRRWRRRLPNCRLQTLERYLCRRVRAGDIPGCLIPQRYHEYVHTGDPRLVGPIFHHNRLDLVAMAELLVALMARPGEGE